MKETDPTYFTWAPDDPTEARYVELDRRVKMVTAEPDYVRAIARSLTEAACGFEHDPDEQPGQCDACLTKQWMAEWLRSVATQSENPTPTPPLSKTKHSELWACMARTVETYPSEGAAVGNRIRDLMHPECREGNNRGSDAVCGECQLLTVLGGACMHASLTGLAADLDEGIAPAERLDRMVAGSQIAARMRDSATAAREAADDVESATRDAVEAFASGRGVHVKPEHDTH